MKKRKIVIVGGGIGGLCLARYLVADGHQVTIVERAADFSAQGHSIAFRGVGIQVTDELGLTEGVDRAGREYVVTHSRTMDGKLLRSVSTVDQAKAVGGVKVTQRGLLHTALHDNLPKKIRLMFGVRPVAITESGEKVTVELNDGTSLEADIVVGADGANSAVRALVMPEMEVVDCGGVYAAMSIKTDHGLPINEVNTYYGTAQVVGFFPVNAQEVALVIYQDDGHEAPPPNNDPVAWAPYLARVTAGAAEPVHRILSALKAGDDVYHDRIRRVPPQPVVKGRVALLGDSGYAPTFFAGNGAGIAAVGAYVLHKCLLNSDDDRAALAAYNDCIVPLAAGYQANATRLRAAIFARSPFKTALRRFALKYTPAFVYAIGMRRHYKGAVKLADLL